MLMSRLRTDTRTDGHVKVGQYSAEAESAITIKMLISETNSMSRCLVQIPQIRQWKTIFLTSTETRWVEPETAMWYK